MPAQRLPWFKFWIGATGHAKVRQLTDAVFRTWVELLDLSAQQNHRGTFSSRKEAAAVSRRPAAHISQLVAAGLLDERDGELTMHDWDDWQRWRPNDPATTTEQLVNDHVNDSRTSTSTTPERPRDEHAMTDEALARRREKREERRKTREITSSSSSVSPRETDPEQIASEHERLLARERALQASTTTTTTNHVDKETNHAVVG